MNPGKPEDVVEDEWEAMAEGQTEGLDLDFEEAGFSSKSSSEEENDEESLNLFLEMLNETLEDSPDFAQNFEGKLFGTEARVVISAQEARQTKKIWREHLFQQVEDAAHEEGLVGLPKLN